MNDAAATDTQPVPNTPAPAPYYELREMDADKMAESRIGDAHNSEPKAREAAEKLLTDGQETVIGDAIHTRGIKIEDAAPIAIVRCVEVLRKRQDGKGDEVVKLSEPVCVMRPGDLAVPSVPMRNHALGKEKTSVIVVQPGAGTPKENGQTK